MNQFPFEAFLQAKRDQNNRKAQQFQEIAGLISQVGQSGSQLLQAKMQKNKQDKMSNQVSAFLNQQTAPVPRNISAQGVTGISAASYNPETNQASPLTQPNPNAQLFGSLKGLPPELAAKIIGPLIQQQQKSQSKISSADSVPFEQAQEVARIAGKEEAATPFIETAKKQGRDFLNKSEMANLYKTVTTSASSERGGFYKRMVEINQGRLDLAKNTAVYGGQLGKNQLSLNTALGHVQSADKAYEDVNNTDSAFLNVPINKLRKQSNDPSIVRLGISLNALQGELANAFKGSGATDQEIGAWQQYLNENLTPAQFHAALPQISDLLGSRLDALQFQQENVVPGTPKGRLLSPHAKEVRDEMDKKTLKRKIFNSPQEAEAANLPKGTRITINGRAAVIE